MFGKIPPPTHQMQKSQHTPQTHTSAVGMVWLIRTHTRQDNYKCGNFRKDWLLPNSWQIAVCGVLIHFKFSEGLSSERVQISHFLISIRLLANLFTEKPIALALRIVVFKTCFFYQQTR